MDNRFETATKLILKREAYTQLPPLLQDAVQKFLAKQVFFLEGHPPLSPAADPIEETNDFAQQNAAYVRYVRKQLDGGERDTGRLKSFMQGLRSCGPDGQALRDQIKTKLLR
ncbi:MAG: hypothetical protein ACO3PR_15405 [Limisphaerales bacterium]